MNVDPISCQLVLDVLVGKGYCDSTQFQLLRNSPSSSDSFPQSHLLQGPDDFVRRHVHYRLNRCPFFLESTARMSTHR